MIAVQGAVILQEPERAQRLERLRCAREIRLVLLDNAPERSEGASLAFERRGDARIHRQPAEIAAPGDAYLLEAALQRTIKHRARLRDRCR